MKYSKNIFLLFIKRQSFLRFSEFVKFIDSTESLMSISKSFPAETSVISIALFLPLFVANKTSS